MDNDTNKKYIIGVLCAIIIFIFFNYNNQINKLEDKILFQENEIEELNNTIKNKNEIINELKSSIDSLDNNINILNDNVKDLQEETEENIDDNFNYEFTDGSNQ